MDWKDTDPGNNPVCLVGAGFQKAGLKEPMPSTNDIIKETVNNNGDQFPILLTLCNNLSPQLDLNYIWRYIDCLSVLLANYYHQICHDYKSLDNMIAKVIEVYKSYNSPPQEIIWVVFGLEWVHYLILTTRIFKIQGSFQYH